MKTKREVQAALIKAGFEEAYIDLFLEACIQSYADSQSNGPQVLMEMLTVRKFSGAFAASLKPENIFINLPRLFGSLGSMGLGLASGGEISGAFLSMVGVFVGSSINISKHDATIALSLHDLGAYLSRKRLVSREVLMEKADGYSNVWSIQVFDDKKFEESINNLNTIKSVAIVDGKFALTELVVLV